MWCLGRPCRIQDLFGYFFHRLGKSNKEKKDVLLSIRRTSFVYLIKPKWVIYNNNKDLTDFARISVRREGRKCIKAKSGDQILRSNLRFHDATTVVNTSRQATVKNFRLPAQPRLNIFTSNFQF